MQNKFQELREKHPVFTYERYEIADRKDKLSITYYFNLGDSVTFTPRWEFSKKHKDINYEKEEIIHKLAFQLGLVELISYWKCACSPQVRIQAGSIDEEQIAWWKMQYFLGLGEFFYTNKIETDLLDFMRMECCYEPADIKDVKSGDAKVGDIKEEDVEAEDVKSENVNTENIKSENIKAYGVKEDMFKTDFVKSGCLIPVGGGKDSLVTLELLSDRKDSNLCYMINYKDASMRSARLAGYTDEDILIAKRTLDSKLLTLNKEGYLNGHTPFSAIVAFSSVLAAYLYDKEYVALSNESSANESTVEGTDVNHQYSKSYKFECDFIKYEEKYINSGVHYFSLLRPFSELQIAKFFAKHPKYYGAFRSCNVGSKEDKWCGVCPKCLFVYVILSPFIHPHKLIEIFGRDLLNDESLIPIFDKLIGIAPEKPFECVGTCDEVNTAICMAIEKWTADKEELPKLYQYYQEKETYSSYINDKENRYIHFYDNENSVPVEFVDRIKTLMLEI